MDVAAPAGAAINVAERGWGWRTLLATPAVVGGVVGGIAGYVFAR